MTAIGSGDLVMPAPDMAAPDIAKMREEFRSDARSALDASTAALKAVGGTPGTTGIVEESPVGALADKVEEVDAREAIILTRPHLVAEFFHVDWTSRARRHIGVPVLHLLEHDAS